MNNDLRRHLVPPSLSPSDEVGANVGPMTDEVRVIDLDAIEADLEMVEHTLATLAAGIYFARTTDAAPNGGAPTDVDAD